MAKNRSWKQTQQARRQRRRASTRQSRLARLVLQVVATRHPVMVVDSVKSQLVPLRASRASEAVRVMLSRTRQNEPQPPQDGREHSSP